MISARHALAAGDTSQILNDLSLYKSFPLWTLEGTLSRSLRNSWRSSLIRKRVSEHVQRSRFQGTLGLSGKSQYSSERRELPKNGFREDPSFSFFFSLDETKTED